MSGEPSAAVIAPAALEVIFREALAAFPAECCGWVTLTGARPCVNAQGAGAGIEGRSAETAYVIGGADLLALNRAFDGADPPVAIYHSHPNGRAYFSATDRGVAMSPFGDGPAYPAQQLVVGVLADRVVEWALFAWSDAAGDFVEVARHVV
jgi:proteasome lid subunit RPN8/RPN11